MLILVVLLAMALLSVVRGHLTETNFSHGAQNSTFSPLMEPVARIPTNASLPLDPNEVRKNISVFPSVRLPSTLKPTEYNIKIFPVPLGSQIFRGHVEIDLEVVVPTYVINLNIANLTLDRDSLTVTASGGTPLKVIDYSFYEEYQVGTFTLEKVLFVGDTIKFSSSYEGQLKTDSSGLNQIIYQREDGTESRILATYMQPVGARHVFPCMDEPGLKARFVIQVGTFEKSTVLSNMPMECMLLTENGTHFWYQFQKSLPMSTYLVAFVISDFEAKSYYSNVKVWSRKAVLRRSAYASYLAPRSLKWFEQFLDMDYVLPKLDLVTFPSYTVPGMENFGLITTDETSLTTNGKPGRKEWVATVTAHEIAHQWAGNLVTPAWWSQYWLSEGFATYLAARALDELEPSLEPMNHLVVKNIHKTLNQDIDERSSALVVENFNPLVEDSKNLPMYYKGSAMIRMLNSIFGEELLKEGLREYFKTFQFKTVSELDFYSILTKVVDKRLSQPNFHDNQMLPTTLDNIMKTWTRQKGYPLITVTRTPEGGIRVNQNVLRKKDEVPYSPSASTLASPSQAWWIPISFASSGNPDFSKTSPRTWLHPSKGDTLLEGVGPQDSWVILNVQETVYARVNYDNSLWKAIGTQLLQNHKVIHVLNRAQLFNDAYHLFNNGYNDANPLMKMFSYLSREKSYFPLKSAFDSLRNIETDMRGDIHYPIFKNFTLSFLSPLLAGHFRRGHMEKKRYELVLSRACIFHHSACVKFAKERFTKFQQTNDISVFPEADLEAILCSAIEEGTEKEWHFLFQAFMSSSKTEKLRRQYINALACTKSRTLVQRYMEDIISPALNLTLDDARDMFDGLARSLYWNKETWDFITSKITRIKERFNGTPLPFVVTPYDLKQLKSILEGSHLGTSPDHFAYYISESEGYAARNARIVSSVSTWLVQNSPYICEA